MKDNRLEKLFRNLRSDSRDVRWRAVEEIGEIGDVRAIEVLFNALWDDDWQVSENGSKGNPDTGPDVMPQCFEITRVNKGPGAKPADRPRTVPIVRK